MEDKNQPSGTVRTGSSVDGFVSPTRAAINEYKPSAERYSIPVNEPVAQDDVVAPVIDQQPKKVKKSVALKIFLVLFIILFLAAGAGAGYFYMQYTQAKDDLKTAQDSNASLQSVNNKATETAQTLATENAAKLNAQKAYASQLNTVATQLKTTCGTNCKNITIPVVPAE
jgi:uncharacterized protein HemX